MLRGAAFVRAAAAAAIVLLTACAGPAKKTKTSLLDLMSQRRYADAAALIRDSKREYGSANSVLYNLDLGWVLHEAGQWRESGKFFQKASDRMDELFTRSVSKAAGAAVANETVEDYRAEPFERSLTHMIHALNYLSLGKRHEALVEIRALESFLDEHRREAADTAPYKDDPFARYFAALLYEDAGKTDDARISFESAQRAYQLGQPAFAAARPPFDFPTEFGESGELVFLHYAGAAPQKVSKSSLLSLIDVRYPEFEPAATPVKASEIQVGFSSAATQLAHDIEISAVKELEAKIAMLKARSAARSTIKLIGSVTGINASDSEFPDLRSWSTLPAQIRFARLKLPPGVHSVTSRYRDFGGNVLFSRDFTVTIQKGRRSWIYDRTLP